MVVAAKLGVGVAGGLGVGVGVAGGLAVGVVAAYKKYKKLHLLGYYE